MTCLPKSLKSSIIQHSGNPKCDRAISQEKKRANKQDNDYGVGITLLIDIFSYQPYSRYVLDGISIDISYKQSNTKGMCNNLHKRLKFNCTKVDMS